MNRNTGMVDFGEGGLRELHANILIIENDPVIGALLPEILEESGHRSTWVTSGQEAEPLLRSQQHHLVFLDWNLDDEDGLELTARWRSEGIRTPILLMTASAEAELYKDALRAGCDDFLRKPLTPAVVLMRTQSLLRQALLERERAALISETISGVVKLLGELIEVTNPVAAQHSQRIQKLVAGMAEGLRWKEMWTLETASMLSLMGALVMPPEILEKVSRGKPLSLSEQRVYRRHPRAAQGLLQTIPMFERVAAMVGHQAPELRSASRLTPLDKDKSILRGGLLLHLATQVSLSLSRGEDPDDIVTAYRRRSPQRYRSLMPAGWQDALDAAIPRKGRCTSLTVSLKELREGMVIDQDVLTGNGTVLLGAGRQLNRLTIERIHRFASSQGIKEPIYIESAEPQDKSAA